MLYYLYILFEKTMNNLQTTKIVNLGPSGRAVAQPMDVDLLDNFYEHLTMERYANVQYFSIYLWFQERDLDGFASYFLSESQGEMEHAYKFANYFIARGQTVKLKELPAPIQTWDSIEELISYSFNICLLYTSPSPRDQRGSRMPSSA